MRAAILLVLVAAHAAYADTIALVSDDAGLRSALEDAGNKVVIASDKPPAVGELAAASRGIADRTSADATVWLLASGTGATLVTYDHHVDRVLVRELPYAPPLDGPKALEAARMVKTMLGALRVVEIEPAPRIAPVVPVAPAAAPKQPQLALAVGGGVWVAAPGAMAHPHATVVAAWRPASLGIAMSATLAPAANVTEVMGDVRDSVLAAEVRNAIALGPRLRALPSVGVALHLLHVDGDVVDSRRYDPAIRLGLDWRYTLPSGLQAGVEVSADALLRRQSYRSGTTEILTVPRVQIVTAFVVGIQL